MIIKTDDGVYFSRELTLNYMDCDRDRKMHLSSITGHIADSWVYGDEPRGYTYEYFQERQQTHAITKLAIKIQKRPMMSETITVTSWNAGHTENRAYKNAVIKNSQGETLVSARMESALLDMVNHTALSMDSLDIETTPIGDLEPDCPPCKRIAVEGTLPCVAERALYFTDMDCNYHVSNTVYTRFVVDSLGPRLREREPKEVHFNYIRETMEGENLFLHAAEAGESYFAQGVDENGKLRFCCELVF